MRVVHIESVKALGGQTLRLVEEAKGLRARGHECTLIGGRDTEFHKYARDLVPFQPFVFKRWRAHPANFVPARRMLQELKAEVVHTHSSKDAWVFGLAARSLGLPIVRGRHISRPFRKGQLRNFVYTQLADAFTVSGTTIRQQMLDAGLAREDNCFVTPAAVNAERFHPGCIDPTYVRAELGLEAEDLLLGTACNFRLAKGVDVLLQAFRKLLETHPRAHLCIAGRGDPDFFAEYVSGIESHVHFLGFRNDIPQVLGGLDLLVLSSAADEGVPGVLAQSLAVGTPIVCTRTGSVTDVIKNGETGLLVPTHDPQALLAAIEKMLAMQPEERDAMRRHGTELIAEDYSIESICKTYERAYAVACAH